MPESRYTSSGVAPKMRDHYAYAIPAPGKSFDDIQRACLKNKKLYEDPDFPAANSSLFPIKGFPDGFPDEIVWKRPHEIVSDPQMFVGGADRSDIRQGVLGDCWFLAALEAVCDNRRLLEHVVPQDQSFDAANYCGAFRFVFWQFGEWVEVVVDDRLPTIEGYTTPLVFLNSVSPNEFWASLVEKAYAKIYGSYEAIVSGIPSEAMEDMSGGMADPYKLTKDNQQNVDNFFNFIQAAILRGSLLACAINAPAGCTEEKLSNGLVLNHAFGITDVTKIQITQNGQNKEEHILRLRNPWGNDVEWNGDYSDDWPGWKNVSDSEKKRLNLTSENNGEFWMSYRDFVDNFRSVEICHVPMQEEEKKHVTRCWDMTMWRGAWVKNVSAGGNWNLRDTFHTNPKYYIEVKDPDDTDDDNTGTLCMGIMQKDYRKKKAAGKKPLSIGYWVFKLRDTDKEPLPPEFFRKVAPVTYSKTFMVDREVCARLKLAPGRYCVVPSTMAANEEGEFIVRIFSEVANTIPKESDEATQLHEAAFADKGHQKNGNTEDAIRKLYDQATHGGKELTASALQQLLTVEFKSDLRTEVFNIEICRSLVALLDLDKSGKLSFNEFESLWNNLQKWKQLFRDNDQLKKKYLLAANLRDVLRSAGYTVSNATFQALATRYSDDEGHVTVEDFIQCVARLKTMFDIFKERKTKADEAVFNTDQFIQMTMYS